MQLFQESTTTYARHAIAYNLFEAAPGLYLPNAFIVLKDKKGDLTHIQKKASQKIIASYGLELTDLRKQLFDIIDKLEVKNLEQKFNPPRRKAKPLLQLLEQAEIKVQIIKLVHQAMDQFLTLIKENQLPLCWEVEKKALVKDVMLTYPKNDLKPLLHFQRLEDKVLYRLRFDDENSIWTVHSKDVVSIVNHPAWLFVDYQLYRVNNINGNMVKPFCKKDELPIPRKSVKVYFQKFIIKQAAKLDIEAEGFEVKKIDNVEACQLELMQDIFTKDLGLNVHFFYPEVKFYWNDPKRKRSLLEFDEEEVVIKQIIRNKSAEEKYLNKLKALGLKNHEGNYFQLKERTEHSYQLLEWLRAHKTALEKEGFSFSPFTIDGKPISMNKPSIRQEVKKGNDWFDLYIVVQVGTFTIPFFKLAPYIREGNPFFQLPDGNFFLIPQEWMTKYLGLAQFGKREKEAMRLVKSQYTLLKDLEIEMEDDDGIEDWRQLDFQPSSLLNATLRPYQLEGVKWLVWNYQKELGVCLADDMGLGKTLQTITALLHAKEQKAKQNPSSASNGQQINMFGGASDLDYLKPLNALIILPASLVFNWENEIKKFAKQFTSYRHTGPKRHKDIRLLIRNDAILTTYQTALNDVELLKQIEFEYIILDESQQIKNKDSKVFKAINELNAKHKISLSGTPIENSLADLWSQMQFINPGLLKGFAFFKKEFITPIEKRQDDEKKERLRNLVSPFLLRRTKEEVAKDLPSLEVRVFYSEMLPEQKKLYEKEKSKARNYLLENFQSSNFQYQNLIIRTLLRLRQLVNHPSLVFEDYTKGSGKFQDILAQWNIIQKSGHKTLLFSSFVKYLELFKSQFQENDKDFSWLTGSVNAKKREAEIKRFQEEESVQSFLISTKAGGTGLNLTAADYVFLLDPWWNPAAEKQAIARAHRIGQTKKVFATKFITKDSIEEKILALQERKSALAQDILEGAGKQKFSRNDLEFLLE